MQEIKYKIPEKWTKRFQKFDIIPIDLYKKTAISNERGKVNKQSMIEEKLKIVKEYERLKEI